MGITGQRLPIPQVGQLLSGEFHWEQNLCDNAKGIKVDLLPGTDYDASIAHILCGAFAASDCKCN